uniref:Uncharacterized protein n=1 Tax=Sphaerodactylus townsendi TaxID=933632 RepID=A0ACB8F7C5_9SAUR
MGAGQLLSGRRVGGRSLGGETPRLPSAAPLPVQSWPPGGVSEPSQREGSVWAWRCPLPPFFPSAALRGGALLLGTVPVRLAFPSG